MPQPTLPIVSVSRFARLRPLVIALLAVFVLSGCSSINRNAACALVGFGAGTAVGVVVAANDEGASDAEMGGEVAAGAVGGALIGYGACAIADLIQ